MVWDGKHRLPDELSPGEARIPVVFVVMLYPLVQVDLLRPKGRTPGGEELCFLVFSNSWSSSGVRLPVVRLPVVWLAGVKLPVVSPSWVRLCAAGPRRVILIGAGH